MSVRKALSWSSSTAAGAARATEDSMGKNERMSASPTPKHTPVLAAPRSQLVRLNCILHLPAWLIGSANHASGEDIPATLLDAPQPLLRPPGSNSIRLQRSTPAANHRPAE